MTRKQKKMLYRILIAAVLLIAVVVLDHSSVRLWLAEWLKLLFAIRVPGQDASGNFVTGDYLPVGCLYLIAYVLIG